MAAGLAAILEVAELLPRALARLTRRSRQVALGGHPVGPLRKAYLLSVGGVIAPRSTKRLNESWRVCAEREALPATGTRI